jgi:hypothetical protein
MGYQIVVAKCNVLNAGKTTNHRCTNISAQLTG